MPDTLPGVLDACRHGTPGSKSLCVGTAPVFRVEQPHSSGGTTSSLGVCPLGPA